MTVIPTESTRPTAHTSIKPGKLWLDTNGTRIHAHGGSILEVDGDFCWYGENKERSAPGTGIWHWGSAATPPPTCTTGPTGA